MQSMTNQPPQSTVERDALVKEWRSKSRDDWRELVEKWLESVVPDSGATSRREAAIEMAKHFQENVFQATDPADQGT